MKEMIACCGLVCTECPAYIATQNGDDKLRKKNGFRLVRSFMVM